LQEILASELGTHERGSRPDTSDVKISGGQVEPGHALVNIGLKVGETGSITREEAEAALRPRA